MFCLIWYNIYQINMRITKAAEHSIQILYQLAKRKTRLTATELASLLSAPINHLYKLIQALAKAKYILTEQGKTGGVELLKPPDKISLLEIVEYIDGKVSISNCFLGKKTCASIQNCRLKVKLNEARDSFVKVLKNSTIQDLLAGERG